MVFFFCQIWRFPTRIHPLSSDQNPGYFLFFRGLYLLPSQKLGDYDIRILSYTNQYHRGRGGSPLTNGPVAGTDDRRTSFVFFLGGKSSLMEQHLMLPIKKCPRYKKSFWKFYPRF